MIETAVVHDRFLSTLGGGERYACSFAMALRDEGIQTAILSDELVDRAMIEERLRVDLDGIDLAIADPTTSGRISEASREIDLFINVSYLSYYVPLSRRAILAVHFPEPNVERVLADGLDATSLQDLIGGIPCHVFTGETHWTPDEAIGLGPDSHLELLEPGMEGSYLRIWLPSNSILAAASVRIEAESIIDHVVLTRGEQTRIPTETFRVGIPTALRATMIDWRQARELETGAVAGPLARIETSPQELDSERLRHAGRVKAVRSYDRIVANSAFSANWIERIWGVTPRVLYPAATSEPATASKTAKILHIGRFFPRADSDHYKGQLELLDAYLALPDQVRHTWNMTFIGGAGREAESLLTRMWLAAEGENVNIITNASGVVLNRNLAEASIYWHATGFGREVGAAQLEHFGIATVEAMAAGAVPVVIDKAGQRETVVSGESGFRWNNLEELTTATLRLIEEDSTRKRMSAAAVERAKYFSEEAFQRRFRDLLSQLETELAI